MKKIVLTGGGSAGHAVPNLALLPRLQGRFQVFYLGTEGVEKRIFAPTGIPYHTLSAVKLVRGSVVKNLLLPVRLLQSVRQARRVLSDLAPDLLFSKGGYVALPAVLAAKKLGIPVLTHESDLTPGLANRLIAGRCRAVLTSFPETAQRLKNAKFTGSPVREELFTAERGAALKKYGFSGKKPVLLCFGGGSGSAAINAALDKALPELSDWDVLHIRGKGDLTKKEGYVPLEYEQDMASAYACADYVLSRAGSNTLFELLALKKPALLIPLDNRRSRGDQAQNAEYFLKRGLCRVLPEKQLSPSRLVRELRLLAADKDLPARLARAPFTPANERIVREIEQALSSFSPQTPR